MVKFAPPLSSIVTETGNSLPSLAVTAHVKVSPDSGSSGKSSQEASQGEPSGPASSAVAAISSSRAYSLSPPMLTEPEQAVASTTRTTRKQLRNAVNS